MLAASFASGVCTRRPAGASSSSSSSSLSRGSSPPSDKVGVLSGAPEGEHPALPASVPAVNVEEAVSRGGGDVTTLWELLGAGEGR